MLRGPVCRELNSVIRSPLLRTILGNTPFRESTSLAVAREAGENFCSLLGSSSLVWTFMFCCSSLTILGHTQLAPPLLSPTHTDVLSEEVLRDVED